MAIDLVKSTGASASTTLATSGNTRTAITQGAAQAASQHHEVRQVEMAAVKLEAHLLGMGRSLEFRVDSQTNTMIVMVRDKDSGEVIRQMPSEEALWLAQHLDVASSFLLNTSA